MASQKNILDYNFAAIMTAGKVIKEGATYTPTAEQLEKLQNFRGFGGVKSILYPIDIEWKNINGISQADLGMEESIKSFYRFLQNTFPNYDEIWADAKESVLTSFYTPDDFVDAQIEAIQQNNKDQIKSALDPSAGNGVYVESLIKYFPNIDITAIEKDYLSALVLKARYNGNDKVKVINSGYEDVRFKQKFDLITSNIPFGNFRVKYPDYDLAVTSKIHNFYFYHSSNLLNEGGVLSFLTSTGVFNSPSNSPVRAELVKNLDFNAIMTLPNNLFKEAGTTVLSHMVTAIKNTNQEDYLIHKNNEYIASEEVEGINLNKSIAATFPNSFFNVDPRIGTNPYGNPEFEYTYPISIICDKIEANPVQRLNISREVLDDQTKELSIEPFPLITADFSLIDASSYLNLIRKNDLRAEATMHSFSPLGIITGNVKGVNTVLATVSKIGDTNGEKKYLIDSYLPSLNVNSNNFQYPKDFKNNFHNLISSIQNIAEQNSLFIEVNTPGTEDGNAFKNYFLSEFKQPILSLSYQTDFPNFNLHRGLEKGMLVINRNNQPALVNDIFENENITIYELKEIDSSYSDLTLIKDYLRLYDAYALYLNSEQSGKDIEQARIGLNNHYDVFEANNGFINENKKLGKLDTFYLPILKALEQKSTTESVYVDLFTIQEAVTYVKADIFNAKKDKGDIGIMEPALALAKSFNDQGKIDIDYISELTELDIDELESVLSDRIIKNPLTKEYELRSLFFSGEIAEKINLIQQLNSPDNDNLIEQLREILPTKIPFEAITIQMGSRWFPKEHLDQFIQQYFNQNFKTLYNSKLDTFFVEPDASYTGYSAKYNSYNFQAINGRYIKPEQLIFNAFFSTYPIVTYKDADDNTQTDEQATKYYKREITNLRNEFQTFLISIAPEEKERIADIYNNLFNTLVVPTFDTSILDFTEFKIESLGIKSIYEHQKRAVWKSISNEGGIVDHEVGLGKTFEMVASAHFGKKLGIYKKPIILGLKANVPEIAKAYSELLPNSNILFADEKDYAVKNRETFFNKIKNNNYDAVIMSHDQFAMIPQSAEIEADVMMQELKDTEDNLFNAKSLNISKQQLRGLEVTKKNLTIKLEALQNKLRDNKDKNVLSFSQLGIDHIIIDEAHKFKNLMFQTKHSRVSGLGNNAGSQRANNLLTAIRTLQQNTASGEYGATFFSGTPISNSITELYLLQKYLTPLQLEKRGIANFDAWCANFAEKSIDFETNMVNQLISKERFRNFVNLPELSLMYNNMSDIMTGDLAKIDRPTKNENILLNHQTPLQKRFYIKLANFLDSGNQDPLKLDKPLNIDEKGSALSLIAMNLAFKASLDMRMISTKYPDEAQSKVNTLLKQVMNSYNNFDEQKGTQIIFLDISTSKKNLSFDELERNYEDNIFTSLYDDIKYKLIKSGIPEKEIAFIQNFKSENQKAKLSAEMNEGKIRILLGNTNNAGTGLNVQSKLSNIWHLSIPWKPAEIEQRNGRGFRKGNLLAKHHNNNTIDIAMSATKNTLDNYKVDLNKNKQKFITQLKGAAIGEFLSRTLDEGAMDENSGMNLAELQAQLTGDNTMLEKLKIDNKIKDLEQERMFLVTKNNENKNKLNDGLRKIENLTEANVIFQNDYNTYNKNVVKDEAGQRINKPHYVDLKEDATNEQIFNYLKKIDTNAQQFHQDQEQVIAKMYGFELYVSNHVWDGVTFKIRNENDPKTSYSITEGKINTQSQSAAISYFVKCFDSIQRKVENAQNNIDKEQHKVDALKLVTDVQFTKEPILTQLSIERDVLEDKIKKSAETNQHNYETKTVIIEDMEVPFKVINELDKMEKAVLYEHLGAEGTEIGIFCNSKIKEFTLDLLEQENCGAYLLNQNNDLKTQLHFIKFKVEDYDKLYLTFDQLYKKEIFQCLPDYLSATEKYDGETVLLTANDKDYYCYNAVAEEIATLNNIPLLNYNDIKYLNISDHNLINIKPVPYEEFKKIKINKVEEAQSQYITKGM